MFIPWKEDRGYNVRTYAGAICNKQNNWNIAFKEMCMFIIEICIENYCGDIYEAYTDLKGEASPSIYADWVNGG